MTHRGGFVSDEISEREALALHLFKTWLVESGGDRSVWMPNLDSAQVTALKWIRMEPYERDAWCAVATRAQELLTGYVTPEKAS